MLTSIKTLLIILSLFVLFAVPVAAQTAAKSDSVMITIFLKHQENKNLDSLQSIQKKNKFGNLFPPKGARIVGWYVMMGVGQVVIVKITPAQLRDLNVAIEKGAWGAFNTEFYPTYDYLPLWNTEKAKVSQ